MDKKTSDIIKITFLGTASGVAPTKGYRHTSFAFEVDKRVFFFDAGESCSYTAHTMGLDLLKTEAVFISHVHIDHLGGLINLLWTIRKLYWVHRENPLKRRLLEGKTIEVFLPKVDMEVWEAIRVVLREGGRGDNVVFNFKGRPVQDGIIFNKDNFKVIALHNLHINKPEEENVWRSFSYRVEYFNKIIVYSGDIRHISELFPLLEGDARADLLLMESGHHKVADVCNQLVLLDIKPKKLGFVHHGRAVLGNFEGELAIAKEIWGDSVFFAKDGMSIEV
ncbi:MBL fold metallo-hydrolase [bacterium]|nr:MBL fold metallo-hydrolase [bacterium]